MKKIYVRPMSQVIEFKMQGILCGSLLNGIDGTADFSTDVSSDETEDVLAPTFGDSLNSIFSE